MDNKELEEEARIHANLKKDFDLEDELYYNPTGMNAYYSFQDGANSKWVQAERIKFALEKLRIFKDLRDKRGYFGGYDNGQVIDREIGVLEEQLKQLEIPNYLQKIQVENIKAQIEVAHLIITNIALHNFKDIKAYREEKNKIEDYINNLKQQLKQLEDDQERIEDRS